MPPNKVVSSPESAVADIFEGARVMVAGFAAPGTPQALVGALLKSGIGRLTCICGPWYEPVGRVVGASKLISAGQVAKIITAPPVAHGPEPGTVEGDLQIETMPQGTLAEKIRAGGAGIGGFFVQTGIGTSYQEGKETMEIDGSTWMLESPLKADFALIKAYMADTMGNLVYRLSQRNWSPIMAMAAEVTIVEADHIVQSGELDPELIITPGVYVDRVVSLGGDSNAA